MSHHNRGDVCQQCTSVTYSAINKAKWCCVCGARLTGETCELPLAVDLEALERKHSTLTEQLFSQEQVIETLEARESACMKLLGEVNAIIVAAGDTGGRYTLSLISKIVRPFSAYRYKCNTCKDTGIETCDGNHPCTSCTGKVAK